MPCSSCTLTIGYWKTHADPTSPRTNPDYTLQLLAQQPNGTIWLGTPNCAKSVAVTSSNVVNILKFDGSNGIRKLYAQLLGANSWDNLTRAQKNKVLTWMSTLDRYNNGLVGPGHCSESPTS